MVSEVSLAVVPSCVEFLMSNAYANVAVILARITGVIIR